MWVPAGWTEEQVWAADPSPASRPAPRGAGSAPARPGAKRVNFRAAIDTGRRPEQSYLAGKVRLFRPTASIDRRSEVHSLCAGSRRRRPCPAGSGARGWRRICSPDLFLSPPRRNPHRFRRGFVFSKTEYLDQLPELVLGVKREDSHGALFAPGLSLWISRGIPCSAYTTKYPIPASAHAHP